MLEILNNKVIGILNKKIIGKIKGGELYGHLSTCMYILGKSVRVIKGTGV